MPVSSGRVYEALVTIAPEGDRLTVGEMITYGKALEAAVEMGLAPITVCEFRVSGETRTVVEVRASGDLPFPEPKKPAKKVAAKKTAAAQ